MPKVTPNFIDHISIAVLDVVKAEQDYMKIFGWDVAERYFDPDSHINVSCFKVGLSTVEVMEDEYSGGWYELQDMSGKVVISGMGNATKWVPKKTPNPKAKWLMSATGSAKLTMAVKAYSFFLSMLTIVAKRFLFLKKTEPALFPRDFLAQEKKSDSGRKKDDIMHLSTQKTPTVLFGK